jgi:branched-chain amino acid transport system permease protein
MGINVTSATAAVYALSTVVAGGAGMLIAPLVNVSADMGTLFGIKAFAVAIVGGIMHTWGMMLAGLAYGIVEALITAVLGSSYNQIVTFTLVIVALAGMPHGLFGRAGVSKV